MTRKLLVGLLVAALAVVALGAASVADARTKTRLTISPDLSGFVISDRQSCHSNRKVYLFKKSRRRGRNVRRDKKVGTDRATPNGDGSQWNINAEGGGKYYAYVKPTSKCGSAYSKVVTASDEG